MNKSVLAFLFWGLISLVLLLIAIPTVVVKINNENYRLRNLDPVDISSDMIIKEFKFNPSIDLQGGNIATLVVDMQNIVPDERQANFETNRNALLTRLGTYRSLLKRQFQVLSYDVQDAIATDNSQYRILTKFPEGMTNEKMQIMTTPGNVTFWVDDSLNANPNETEEEKAQKPYGDRKLSTLTNEDIESVNVVSDATTCIFNDPKAPRNYCIALTFKATAEFQEALFANPNAQYPILVIVDGAPVAVQSYGQQFNQADPGREMILFPIVEDTYDTTAILASILNDKPLSNVGMTDFNTLAPLMGTTTLDNLKLSGLLVFIVSNVLLVVYFRKRSWLLVVLNILLMIWSIAVLKMFGSVLDFSLIVGVLAAYVLFNSLLSYFIYQIRSASSASLTEDEVVSIYDKTKKQYFATLILTIVMAFVVSIWGSEFMINLYIGFGFTVILGYLVLLFPAKQLIALMFLASKKWKI